MQVRGDVTMWADNTTGFRMRFLTCWIDAFVAAAPEALLFAVIPRDPEAVAVHSDVAFVNALLCQVRRVVTSWMVDSFAGLIH